MSFDVSSVLDWLSSATSAIRVGRPLSASDASVLTDAAQAVMDAVDDLTVAGEGQCPLCKEDLGDWHVPVEAEDGTLLCGPACADAWDRGIRPEWWTDPTVYPINFRRTKYGLVWVEQEERRYQMR